MKARHFRRIRKRLNNLDYVTQQLRYWGEKDKEWDTWYRFKCNDFFEGKTIAELNRQRYYKEMKVVWKQLERWKYHYDRLTKNI